MKKITIMIIFTIYFLISRHENYFLQPLTNKAINQVLSTIYQSTADEIIFLTVLISQNLYAGLIDPNNSDLMWKNYLFFVLLYQKNSK